MLGHKTQVTGQLGSQPRPATEPFLKTGPVLNWCPLLEAACPNEESIPAKSKERLTKLCTSFSGVSKARYNNRTLTLAGISPKCPDHWILETHQDGKALNFLRVYFPSYSIHVSCQSIRGVCYFLTAKSHWYNFLNYVMSERSIPF